MNNNSLTSPGRWLAWLSVLLLMSVFFLGACSLPRLRDDYMGKSLLQKEKTIHPPVRRDAWGNPVLPASSAQ